ESFISLRCSPARPPPRSTLLPYTTLFRSSTLPARGATPIQPSAPGSAPNFYPRSPRGERRAAICTTEALPNGFLSTLPARGATVVYSVTSGANVDFYPRSPRGERRQRLCSIFMGDRHFYPRSPRGERPTGKRTKGGDNIFLS